MMKRTLTIVLPFALLVAANLLAQTQRRDPLNEKEVDQLREARQEPDTRLKLYAKFAKERMDLIEQMRSDPRLVDQRGPQIHDLLQDLGNIVGEMDDNVDMYNEGKWDIRKPLKVVIDTDTEIQQKLKQMKDAAASDPAAAQELSRNYQFALQDTTEAVGDSLDSARKTMTDQEQMAKAKQLRKPE